MTNREMFIGVAQLNFWSGYRHWFLFSFAMFALLLFTAQPAMAAKFINVKSFGAQGDGVTDDTNAIQQAVNDAAASQGSTVFFPTGRYYHSDSIYVTGNQTRLQGLSSNKSILTGGTFFLSGVGVTLAGLTIDSGIANEADSSAISNCVVTSVLEVTNVTDCLIKGCHLPTGQLRITGSDRVSILNTILTSLQQGKQYLYILSSTNVTVGNCQINTGGGSSIYAVAVNTLLIQNCNIRNIGDSCIECNQTSNLTIRGNTLGGSSGGSQPQNGIYLMSGENILVFNNKIQFVVVAIFSDSSAKLQLIANPIKNVSAGIRTVYTNDLRILNNPISNARAWGIACNLPFNECIIEGNIIKDVGLSFANAVIDVVGGGPGGAGQRVVIRYNIYTGNQQNLNFFILCTQPSPPSVVKGNLTTTLLPTQVGP